jgi:hypothetical protein
VSRCNFAVIDQAGSVSRPRRVTRKAAHTRRFLLELINRLMKRSFESGLGTSNDDIPLAYNGR